MRRTNAPTRRAILAGLTGYLVGSAGPRAQDRGAAVGAGFDDEDIDPQLIAAAGQFALAHVLTGDADVDAVARAGLHGLSMQLAARTTVEPGPVLGIDLDHDDIAPLSVLYWPVGDAQAPPSARAYLMLDRWLRNGGLLVVDTRDADVAGLLPQSAQGGPASRLLAPLDIPPLAPVPADHVLRRSYYLLDSFPGRYDAGTVWVEAAPENTGHPLGGARNDGVTPVIIGGNSWAEAWAVDESGLPLHALGVGFEAGHQRELAYRFGINLVMLALTGNYKSDQVHVQAILDRLGQQEAAP